MLSATSFADDRSQLPALTVKSHHRVHVLVRPQTRVIRSEVLVKRDKLTAHRLYRSTL